MNGTPHLDFAHDRAAHQRRKNTVIAVLGLVFGVQIGMTAWRWQAIESDRAALATQHKQWVVKNAHGKDAELSAEQLKTALAVQSMLDHLTVPWDALLSAIEQARTPLILIDAIEPQAQEGSVSISVSCANFTAVAEFIDRLSHQDMLHDVMLISETLPENGGSLRAVISANWHQTK